MKLNVTDEQIKSIEDALNERRSICNKPEATIAEEAYLRGLVTMANWLGLEVEWVPTRQTYAVYER